MSPRLLEVVVVAIVIPLPAACQGPAGEACPLLPFEVSALDRPNHGVRLSVSRDEDRLPPPVGKSIKTAGGGQIQRLR